ncbi:hypothetical protein D0867_03633 [Hortaea werneckii]|uniref:Uncharacterized protein n=1 Tax=Hortaea werneckii TaxID=91943 RepID=A0A3M7A0H1_HORWE|nr:hypothetical protein D0867_03633 [Hortaea werneckii]
MPVSLQEASSLLRVPFEHGDSYRKCFNTKSACIALYDEKLACEAAPGRFNCTEACEQPFLIWSSSYTFHNCLAYLAISTLMSNGNLTNESLAIAKAAGFTESQHISNAIESSITECAASACDSSSESSESWACGPSFLPGLASFSNVTTLNAEPSLWQYNLVGIVLAAYLYDRMLSTWLPETARFLAFHSANTLAQVDHLRAAIDATHQPALIAGLVDFQKAQCYFAITLQGCALFAIWKGGPLLEAATKTQASLTTAIIGHVAALGMVCIVFTLYILHHARRSSIYVSTVSALAITISMITWTRTRRQVELKTKGLEEDIPNVPAYGGKVDPTRFCAVYFDPDFIKSEAPTVSFSSLAMLWILVRQANGLLVHLKAWRHASRLRPAWWQTVRHRRRGLPEIPGRIAVTTLRFLWVRCRHGLAEATFLSMAAVMIAILSNPYPDGRSWQDKTKWTFGQLIAVTIWAPILIEFLYSAIFGVEEAQEHRLIAPFKVTKQASNSIEDNSKIPLNNGKQDTFYRRLDSPSEMELPLVYVQDGVSAPSGQ